MTVQQAPFPAGLRIADLVAKTAGVTLKDTMRVMLAIDAISLHYNADILDVIETCDYAPSRPAPESVAACEQASFGMSTSNSDVKSRLKKIKVLARKY